MERHGGLSEVRAVVPSILLICSLSSLIWSAGGAGEAAGPNVQMGDWATYRVSTTYFWLREFKAIRIAMRDISESYFVVDVTYRSARNEEFQYTSSENIQNLALERFRLGYAVWSNIVWAIPSNYTFDEGFLNSLVNRSVLYCNLTVGFHVVDHACGGAYRTGGLLNASWAECENENWHYCYGEWVWDRQSGILLSMIFQEGVNEFSIEIVDTNLWSLNERMPLFTKLAVVGAVPIALTSFAVILHKKHKYQSEHDEEEICLLCNSSVINHALSGNTRPHIWDSRVRSK